MKILPVFALFTLTLASLHAGPPSAEEQEFMKQGQAAFGKGDYAAAKDAFEMVYQIDPHNALAVNYLIKLKALVKSLPNTGTQEKQLAGLIVPKVTLKDATIGSVFDYLKTTAGKISDGKASVNFVLKLPDDVIKTQTITLNMTDAPFTEVVKYVAELANLNVKYQQYAVLVTPRAGPAPEAPAPAPAQ